MCGREVNGSTSYKTMPRASATEGNPSTLTHTHTHTRRQTHASVVIFIVVAQDAYFFFHP